MGQKLGRGLRRLSEEGAGSPYNTKSPGQRPTSIPSGILIHPVIWPHHNRYGRRLGGSAPFWGRGSWSSSNTMWSVSRLTCMPSFILIHPTLWPLANVTVRQTGQDRQRRSDSIGRTVLQAVAQKWFSHEKVARLFENVFLAKSNMLENIHDGKLLPPVTVFVESRDTLTQS